MINQIKHRKQIPTLYKELNARFVCEVGVLSGRHIKNLASPGVVCFGVDRWEDDGAEGTNDAGYNLKACYKQARKVQAKKDNIVLLRMDSIEACYSFPPNFFDLVYIDANHVYEAVTEDIENWWTRIRPGGVISGHDYLEFSLNDTTFGVKKAVDEFVSNANLELHITSEEFPSWIIKKP
jgi:hypothetical protein